MNHKWTKSDRKPDKILGEKAIFICKRCGCERITHYKIGTSYIPDTYSRGGRLASLGGAIECVDWDDSTICGDEIMGEY